MRFYGKARMEAAQLLLLFASMGFERSSIWSLVVKDLVMIANESCEQKSFLRFGEPTRLVGFASVSPLDGKDCEDTHLVCELERNYTQFDRITRFAGIDNARLLRLFQIEQPVCLFCSDLFNEKKKKSHAQPTIRYIPLC